MLQVLWGFFMFAFFHQSQCTEYESNNNVFLEYRSIYSRMYPPAVVSNRNYYASLAGASLPCAIWQVQRSPSDSKALYCTQRTHSTDVGHASFCHNKVEAKIVLADGDWHFTRLENWTILSFVLFKSHEIRTFRKRWYGRTIYNWKIICFLPAAIRSWDSQYFSWSNQVQFIFNSSLNQWGKQGLM